MAGTAHAQWTPADIPPLPDQVDPSTIEVLQRLGSGFEGVVYQVRIDGNVYALKVPASNWDDAETFVREQSRNLVSPDFGGMPNGTRVIGAIEIDGVMRAAGLLMDYIPTMAVPTPVQLQQIHEFDTWLANQGYASFDARPPNFLPAADGKTVYAIDQQIKAYNRLTADEIALLIDAGPANRVEVDEFVRHQHDYWASHIDDLKRLDSGTRWSPALSVAEMLARDGTLDGREAQYLFDGILDSQSMLDQAVYAIQAAGDAVLDPRFWDGLARGIVNVATDPSVWADATWMTLAATLASTAFWAENILSEIETEGPIWMSNEAMDHSREIAGQFMQACMAEPGCAQALLTGDSLAIKRAAFRFYFTGSVVVREDVDIDIPQPRLDGMDDSVFHGFDAANKHFIASSTGDGHFTIVLDNGKTLRVDAATFVSWVLGFNGLHEMFLSVELDPPMTCAPLTCPETSTYCGALTLVNECGATLDCPFVDCTPPCSDPCGPSCSSYTNACGNVCPPSGLDVCEPTSAGYFNACGRFCPATNCAPPVCPSTASYCGFYTATNACGDTIDCPYVDCSPPTCDPLSCPDPSTYCGAYSVTNTCGDYLECPYVDCRVCSGPCGGGYISSLDCECYSCYAWYDWCFTDGPIDGDCGAALSYCFGGPGGA